MSIADPEELSLRFGRESRSVSGKGELLSPEELNFHIQQCGLNKRESQQKIYESFYAYTITICRRYAGNHDDSVEILNDGFLKIFKKINHYQPAFADGVSSFKGWIRKIMMFTAIDHYRRNQRQGTSSRLSDEAIQLADEGGDAIDKISYGEIRRFIQKVTPGYRMVLNLYAIEGLTHEEISKQLGISIGTSKSNLAKGRRQLRKLLFLEYY